jgi:hypothetical protein
VFHPDGEPGDGGFQSAVVEQVTRILVAIGEIQWHAECPFRTLRPTVCTFSR